MAVGYRAQKVESTISGSVNPLGEGSWRTLSLFGISDWEIGEITVEELHTLSDDPQRTYSWGE
jgi:hypothetical protein